MHCVNGLWHKIQSLDWKWGLLCLHSLHRDSISLGCRYLRLQLFSQAALSYCTCIRKSLEFINAVSTQSSCLIPFNVYIQDK